jgi:hypothetical protein
VLKIARPWLSIFRSILAILAKPRLNNGFRGNNTPRVVRKTFPSSGISPLVASLALGDIIVLPIAMLPAKYYISHLDTVSE